MNMEPPAGSKIEVERDIHSTIYTWKNGEKTIGQYFTAAFLTFWLCGWTVGGFMAAIMFFTQEDAPLSGRLFILFWLGGWACGEAAVIYILYNIFRPLVPAKLILSPTCFEYRTGTKPFSFGHYKYTHSQDKPKFFQSFRNKIYKVELDKDVNLKLEHFGERQRLSFDIGAERVEIGETLSEPEREWLHEILKEKIG